MSLFKVVEEISPQTAHAVGVSSGVGGIALWAELAQHLTALAGFIAAILVILGGVAYFAYWSLKAYAKYKRIRKGDYSE